MLLSSYLTKNKISYSKFAQLISASGKSIICKYAKGKHIPRAEIQHKIFLATNGAVTPNDFIAQNIAYSSMETKDFQLLKQELEKSRIQHKYVAYELGITPSALSQKLEGKISFKPHEIKKIIDILKSSN